jgi:hypothetical protein
MGFRCKILWIALLQNLLCSQMVYSQQVLFSDSLGEYAENMFYSIAGKLEEKYIVFKAAPGASPEFMVLDSACKPVDKGTLTFIPANGLIKAITHSEDNSCHLFWQSLHGTEWYLHHSIVKDFKFSELTSAVVDSAVLPSTFKYQPYFMRESAGGGYMLLYKRAYDPSTEQLLTSMIIVNTTSGEIAHGQINMPFNKEFDLAGEVIADESGHVFTLTFDNPTNFRLSSTIRLYEYIPGKGQIDYPEIIAKEKKPVGILMHPEPDLQRMVLVSLYYDFYSKNINGITGTRVSTRTLRYDSLFCFTFSKELKKQLNRYISGISNDKAMNFLELRDMISIKNDGLTVLAELYHQSYTPNINLDLNSRSSLLQSAPSQTAFFPQQTITAGGRGGRRGTSTPRGYGLSDPLATGPQRSPNIDNSLFGPQPQSFNINNIPVQYVSLLIQFDGTMQTSGNKILQNRLIPGNDYSSTYTTIHTGSLRQLVYDYKGGKVVLKCTVAGLEADEFSQEILHGNRQHILLLNHSGSFESPTHLLTFYRNPENNSIGIAKLHWQSTSAHASNPPHNTVDESLQPPVKD